MTEFLIKMFNQDEGWEMLYGHVTDMLRIPFNFCHVFSDTKKWSNRDQLEIRREEQVQENTGTDYWSANEAYKLLPTLLTRPNS
jgi:hypothetical protein